MAADSYIPGEIVKVSVRIVVADDDSNEPSALTRAEGEHSLPQRETARCALRIYVRADAFSHAWRTPGHRSRRS